MKDNFLQSAATTKPRRPLSPKRVCFLALALSVGFAAPALAQQQPVPAPVAAPAVPQPFKIDPKNLLMLVRSTLTALDQANKTSNYSVLRDLSAPDFQRDNSLVKVGEIFAGQRQSNLDLGAALVLEPTITLQPQIETNGLLHVAGYFPVNTGARLNFELLFQMVDNKLLIYGLGVNIVPPGSDPAASALKLQVPAAPAAATQTPPPEAAKPEQPAPDPAKAKQKPRLKSKAKPEQPAQ